MASVLPHNGDRWRAFVNKNGIKKSKVFTSKRMATIWANKVEAEIEAQEINETPSHIKVGDLIERYFNSVSIHKKSYRWEKIRHNALKRYALWNVKAKDLKPSHISEYRDQRLEEGVKGSTVNRELNFLSAVFTRSIKEWGWLKANPIKSILRPENPKHRDRRISDQEIDSVIDELHYQRGYPIITKQHEVAGLFLLAIETAMRKSELLDLVWDNIFLEQRYLTIIDSKNSDKRDVPLSLAAIEILKILQVRGGSSLFSVTSGTADTLFRRAVKKAGILNLTFHDSRHEALTRLARKLDVLDLARMVGHRDPRSLMIYYNATASEIALRLD